MEFHEKLRWNDQLKFTVLLKVLTVANKIITAFWCTAPRTLIDLTDRRFRVAYYCLRYYGYHRAIASMMVEINTFETSLNFYETSMLNIRDISQMF